MDEGQVAYTERSRRKSRWATAMILGLFLFTAVVFGGLFTAGSFIAGS